MTDKISLEERVIQAESFVRILTKTIFDLKYNEIGQLSMAKTVAYKIEDELKRGR